MKKRFLVLDTASPMVSLAAGRADGTVAERRIDLRQSSEKLFDAIDEVLRETQLDFQDLDGLAVLQGPGSFTGLRVGLGTALGFHQATGVPATALPTLPILAKAAQAEEGENVVAVVNALRGDWYSQAFLGGGTPQPKGAARLRQASELVELAPCTLIGFGVQQLAATLEPEKATSFRLVETTALAGIALEKIWRQEPSWDASLLTRPIYFREPAVTLPSKPRL